MIQFEVSTIAKVVPLQEIRGQVRAERLEVGRRQGVISNPRESLLQHCVPVVDVGTLFPYSGHSAPVE